MSRATLATLKAAIERGALKAAPVSQLAAYCIRTSAKWSETMDTARCGCGGFFHAA